MKIAVLASPESWYGADLKRAAGTNHELVVLPFDEIRADLWESPHNASVVCDGHDLRQFDAVLVRTMPPGSLEQVVFRMDALARAEAAGVAILNPPRAIEAAVDKYLTSARLHAAGLNTPATCVCQTVDHAMEAFERLGGNVVVKPLFGGEGRGLTRLDDPDLAWRAFKMLTQLNAVLYLQKFIAHDGFDVRLFVVGEDVYGMKRINSHDWRTNVSRGATSEPVVVGRHWRETALLAAKSVGAVIAGVDVVIAKNGTPYVLEVNAVPGWKALAQTLQLDVAEIVLRFVQQFVLRRETRGTV